MDLASKDFEDPSGSESSPTHGRRYIPPRWALGYHETYQELPAPRLLVDVARRFRHHDIPLESLQIVPKSISGDRPTSGAAPINLPEEVVHELHTLGIKTGPPPSSSSEESTSNASHGRRRTSRKHRPLLFAHSTESDLPPYAAPSFPVRLSGGDDLRRMLKDCLDLAERAFSLYGPELQLPDDRLDEELAVRGIQLAVFLPLLRVQFLRPHRSSPPVWPFPSSVEKLWRRYLGWRYKLLPYLYGTLDYHRRTGTPPVRRLTAISENLPAEDPPDDQFLLGRSLLAAPVLAKNIRERSIHLPEGTWFHFWTNRPRQGPRIITQQVPLERIPLFVRGGSVIPLHPYMRQTDEYQPRTLVLRTYPGNSRMNEIYFDDGNTFAFLDGDYHRMTIQTRQHRNRFAVSVEREGDRPVPYEQFEWQLPLSSVKSVTMDERELPRHADPEEFVAADAGIFEGEHFLRVRTSAALNTLELSLH